jgi:4-hydroxybenzoate polyprenyltransferase
MQGVHPANPPAPATTFWERWAGLLRIRQWLHLLPLPIAGYELGKPLWFNVWSLGRGVGIAFCVLSFGYLLNAVSDREMDLDRRKNPLVEIGPAAGTLWLPLALLFGLALSLAASASLWVVACTTISLVSGCVYSMGPRFKSVPFIGTLMNLSNFLPLLFVGMPWPTPTPRLIALAVAFSGMLLQNQLLHEAGDATEDRRGGVQTTFLLAGARWTAVLAMGCGVAVLLTTLWAAERLALPAAMALHALPYVVLFPGLLFLQGDTPARMQAARRTQRWCAAASGALLFFGLR